MLAVIKDLVSVQMIASFSFILPYQLEGDVKEPTLLFEISGGRRPRWCGLYNIYVYNNICI